MAESLTHRQAESARLSIRTAHIVNRLSKAIEGEIELSATQVQAAKILLDKSLPSLQSADITAHSSPQIESEADLLAKLQALIAKYPQLISQLAPSLPSYTPAHTAVEGDTHDHTCVTEGTQVLDK